MKLKMKKETPLVRGFLLFCGVERDVGCAREWGYGA